MTKTSVDTLTNNLHIRWIETDPQNLSAAHIGHKNIFNVDSIPDSKSYGVNGTFFHTDTKPNYKPYDVYRIMTNNGSTLPNQTRSNINSLTPGVDGPAGTFVVYRNLPTGGYYATIKMVTNTTQLSVSQEVITFAVGGVNLRTGESISSASVFHNNITNGASPEYSGGDISKRPRTAILVRNAAPKVILLAVFSGAPNTSGLTASANGGMTPWELRDYIKRKWSDVQGAVMLDGGGSTQIVYQSESRPGYPTREKCLTGPSPRDVQTMIRVNWV